MHLLRKLRRLATLAFVSSIVWVPLNLIALGLDSVLRGLPFSWAEMIRLTPRLAEMGAVCGCVFGIAFAVVERRRTFASLTIARTAVCGAIAGAAIPASLLAIGLTHASTINAILAVSVAGVVGAAMAGGVLAVARRAPALTEARASQQLGEASHS